MAVQMELAGRGAGHAQHGKFGGGQEAGRHEPVGQLPAQDFAVTLYSQELLAWMISAKVIVMSMSHWHCQSYFRPARFFFSLEQVAG